VSLINDKYLIIGDYGPYGDKIFVDLTNKNVFAAFISENINPNTYYICKSVRCLLQCIIEYEKFIFEFINAERTVFCINETNWANILSEILRSIDPQIVDFTKGYFLGGYIERIESGI
jgi:hypothetical protein